MPTWSTSEGSSLEGKKVSQQGTRSQDFWVCGSRYLPSKVIADLLHDLFSALASHATAGHRDDNGRGCDNLRRGAVAMAGVLAIEGIDQEQMQQAYCVALD